MEEEAEKKKRRKKILAIWLSVVVAIIAIAAVSVPFILSALSKKETHKNVVADVSVKAFHVSTLDEEQLFDESFSFLEEDVDATKKTTAINGEIDQENYVKLVYNVTNTTGELYYFKLDFDGVNNKNCKIFYVINNGEEAQMSGKNILFAINQNISISISIKVDNFGMDSKFVGNILFSITAV
ncbi:MAG: hypothetical protein IJ817_01935 [Clostridia bacterium]|nr:hypothetical protein [Clostridia bacterium]